MKGGQNNTVFVYLKKKWSFGGGGVEGSCVGFGWLVAWGILV